MFEILLKCVNDALKNHELYEPWMGFDEVVSLAPGEFRAKENEPVPGQTNLSKEQIEQVYLEAWTTALPSSEKM
ncbi:hypothetical protein LEO76_21855 [Aeromonas hydrophila]|uniref:hypothetical protein n=1 Tax=Aeromonas hydrophila TaxID=644 RepID=UPI001D0A4DE5|nr:hypothetical protein [Aeromonas hydrophila]MCC0184125.1 hypothetical protein [Aeromonas hydrophila]